LFNTRRSFLPRLTKFDLVHAGYVLQSLFGVLGGIS